MKETYKVSGLVLVVDDDKKVLKLINYLFSKYYPNVEVHTVQSGADALQKISQHNYDVIIIDHYLTDMDGTELVSMIKSNGCESLILMITASSKVVVEGVRNNRFDYIHKGNGFKEELVETASKYLNVSIIRKKAREMKNKLERFNYVQ